ncbi:hypothetical protein [Bradyrhizobium sp. SBR1B]|uniref:hypothetical protein n=1 Tax=Bradyrhizobium sp. SBR1B TaxID=2663836 RepID=UPI0016065950|nr:hypothetical protein [Bradyrhizobium sp. SBR1B]MBB4380569.1 hypothetical protein [Bradyrhizobium sp. SBR1B]
MSLRSADSHHLSQVSSWRKADVMQYPPKSALKAKAGKTIPCSYIFSEQVQI